jgi:hypothetical protein
MSDMIVKSLSVQPMTGLLTVPYRRGAETLAIALGRDEQNGTSVVAYDFNNYRARYGVNPAEPKYVLFPQKDTGRDPLEIEVDFSFRGGRPAVLIKIPPGTFAGTSFAIPLPQADATLRLLRFRQRPIPLPGSGADNFGILALLGNIAKLAWAIGWEKDQIRQHLRDVQQQRHRKLAHGFSLDKVGEDLRVPRFPPREHSFDPDTIALYHFNDSVANNDPVVDETTRFGLAGHPGVNAGAQSLAIGKFANGFRFPGPNGNGAITISSDAQFDLPADGSFTVEVFVNADPTTRPGPRIIMMKGLVDAEGKLNSAGWSLSMDGFRGIANNVRWAVSDGNTSIEAFADLNVVDGKFHHLAGALDRTSQRARIFVDGEERASVDLNALGALTNPESIRIGRSVVGHPWSGVVDEVRMSKVVRTDFHPVLGEGDDAYRQRLGIFERWMLPTPDAVMATINGLVQINGEADSFVLIERNRSSGNAIKVVRILPTSLSSGQSIDRDGNSLTKEGDVSGVAGDESDFDPLLLFTHNRPRVDYGADPNHHRMQARTQGALDGLIDLLAAANPPVAGNLIIERAFDEAGPGLHAVGRAVLLRHQNLALESLGALAHQAGFDFVRNDGDDLYVSVAPGEKLAIVIEPGPAPAERIDVLIGQAINLDLAPAGLPAEGQIRWTSIPCGPASAHFTAHPADDTNLRTPVTVRPRLQLIPDRPGEITLRVEYTFRRRVVSGTRTLRISIDRLADQATIADNGDESISEKEAVGAPGQAVNPIYLITSNAADVDFGADPSNRQMQIALEHRFNALLQSQTGLADGLQVLKAFDPNDPGLHRVGRALLLTHKTLAPDQLGALAHQVSFGFVHRQGAQIYCSVAAAEKIEITRAPSLTPLEDELVVGQPADLRVRSDTLPATGNFNWSLTTVGRGRGTFDFVLRSAVRFTPGQPGPAALNVAYLEQDTNGTFPYTFEIRLKPSLEADNAVIPKHQYDLIMNVLNFFHPIGVEVVTSNLRKHVVEIEQDPTKAFPAYTYPDFRV